MHVQYTRPGIPDGGWIPWRSRGPRRCPQRFVAEQLRWASASPQGGGLSKQPRCWNLEVIHKQNGDITSVGIFKFQEFFQSLEYPTIDTIYHWNIIGITIGYHKLEQSLDTQPYRVGTSCSQLLGGTMVISINHPTAPICGFWCWEDHCSSRPKGLEPKKGPLVTRRISYGFINPDYFLADSTVSDDPILTMMWSNWGDIDIYKMNHELKWIIFNLGQDLL